MHAFACALISTYLSTCTFVLVLVGRESWALHCRGTVQAGGEGTSQRTVSVPLSVPGTGTLGAPFKLPDMVRTKSCAPKSSSSVAPGMVPSRWGEPSVTVQDVP